MQRIFFLNFILNFSGSLSGLLNKQRIVLFIHEHKCKRDVSLSLPGTGCVLVFEKQSTFESARGR